MLKCFESIECISIEAKVLFYRFYSFHFGCPLHSTNATLPDLNSCSTQEMQRYSYYFPVPVLHRHISERKKHILLLDCTSL